jgi:hypothetical protein
MAVVINGTTGIDKVQDGSIGTVDIAADAITTAKIAAALDLSATTLTMPTGHIIQQVIKTSATVVTVTNSSTLTAFGLTQAFTPKFANSIILIVANVAGEHYGSHADRGLRYEFRKGGSQIRYWPYMDYHSTDSSQNISTQSLYHSESATNTTARTYEVRFCASTGTNTSSRMNNYNGPSRLIITEIAG